MNACAQSKSWEQIDTELHGANWPGSYAHDQTEYDAYARTANCCPQIAGFTPTGTCAGVTAPGTPGTTPGDTTKPTSLSAFVIAHPVESLVGGVLAGVLLSKMLG